MKFEERVAGCLEEKFFHYVPEPNDSMQPSFRVHAVVTAPSYEDKKLTWAFVSGYEAIGQRDESSIRDRRLINEFCNSADRILVQKDPNLLKCSTTSTVITGLQLKVSMLLIFLKIFLSLALQRI